MGYDLSCRGEHPDVAEAYAAARQGGYEDRQAWENYEKLQQEQHSYFRANIFGMGKLREWMHEANGLAIGDSPIYPKEIEGVDRESMDHRQADLYVYWLTQGHPAGLIPIWKLGSNDGWIVTPEEIRASLRAMTGWAPPTRENVSFWKEWCAFLRHTAKHHGFETW